MDAIAKRMQGINDIHCEAAYSVKMTLVVSEHQAIARTIGYVIAQRQANCLLSWEHVPTLAVGWKSTNAHWSKYVHAATLAGGPKDMDLWGTFWDIACRQDLGTPRGPALSLLSLSAADECTCTGAYVSGNVLVTWIRCKHLSLQHLDGQSRTIASRH